MPAIDVDLDDFGAERGFFQDFPDADRRGGRPWNGTWRRNLDFLRLKDHALHLVSPRPGMKVLDPGGANGAQMVMLGLQGAEVEGQDLDAPAVEEANRKLEKLGIEGRARVGDSSRLHFVDE